MAKEWRATGTAVSALSGFDDAVKAWMTQNDVPNGALAVAQGQRLVLARGYTWGEPDQETTQPASLFRIASCSKPITSLATYQLQEAGTLALTTTAQSILNLTAPNGGAIPGSPAPANTNTAGTYFPSVQVDHLLQHAGGWDRNMVEEPTYFKDDEVATAFNKELPVSRTEIARWGATQQMQFWPGSRTAYSNFGYSLLGLVIEQLTGSDYIQHVRDRIFAPLGITRPRLAMPLERSRLPGEVAYYPDGGGWDADDLTGGGGKLPIQYGGENNANFASFGGWAMAAPDYARLLAAYAGTAPPTTILPRNMLGWFRSGRGGGCTEHGGGLKGTSAYIGLRDDGIAIVAFFNKDATGNFQWQGSTQSRDNVLHSVADGIGSWPANDLFPSVMTAPLTPGPEKLHVFISAPDKLLRDASWERNVANRWLGWWRIRQGSAPAGAPITAVSRHPSKLDVFHVGNDGRVYTAAWEAGRTVERWRGWWSIQDGRAQVGSAVTAVARHPGKLDVFVVGTDGGVYTAAWDANMAGQKWRGWWRIGNLQAKLGTTVAAVARDPDRLDVFVAGADGKVWSAAWSQPRQAEGWRGWWHIRSGSVAPGGAVTAISRHPDKLDVFHVGNDRRVYTAAWERGFGNDEWRGWWPIGSLQAVPGTPVNAVARDPDRLDVFTAGADGKVWSAAWSWPRKDEGWRGWWNIQNGLVAPGGSVTAVSRNPKKLDVFHVGNDSNVYTAAWDEAVADGKWRGWWRVRDAQGKAGAPVGTLARRLS
ncbi:MAG: beta-lactamase family protein [Actinomycetota bacterium]|nr:beta-lactamase family protein [Actinomycetota bacterium]